MVYPERLKKGFRLLFPFEGTEKNGLFTDLGTDKISKNFLTEYKRLSFLQQQNFLASQA
jgi:hypothetical protein